MAIIGSTLRKMNMTEEQKRFIEMYSFERKNYYEIEKEMNWTRAYIKKLRTPNVDELIADIQKIRTKFTKSRKKAFKESNKDFRDFYDWYKDQKQKCAYCGISQENLYILFAEGDARILPYLVPNKIYKNAPKRSSGTLEIERLDCASAYIPENMILACPLCNNAKSNLIDEESWCELFVPAMQEYYKKLLTMKNVVRS
jgi:hypothetical protein